MVIFAKSFHLCHIQLITGVKSHHISVHTHREGVIKRVWAVGNHLQIRPTKHIDVRCVICNTELIIYQLNWNYITIKEDQEFEPQSRYQKYDVCVMVIIINSISDISIQKKDLQKACKVARYEKGNVATFTVALSGWNGIMHNLYILLIYLHYCINIIRVFCILCNNYWHLQSI